MRNRGPHRRSNGLDQTAEVDRPASRSALSELGVVTVESMDPDNRRSEDARGESRTGRGKRR
jgi:hypothetical protein